ncbi:MAG TPA: hypothetical protein VE153_12005 [Myxococcus sp.]|nr:hypothetical protein [Myxococcus sp.]
MLVLNCPGCGSKVAADAAICNVCDYIIDTSFLSTEPPGSNDEDGDEGTGAEEPPRPAAKPAAPARPRSAGDKSGSRAAVASSADATNVKSMDEIVRSAPPRPGRGTTGSRGAVAPAPPRRPPPPKPAAPAPEAFGGDPWDRAHRPERGGDDGDSGLADTGELMAEAREFMGLLSSADKLAFWGAVTVILSCFLPWKSTAAEEDVLGLMSLGFGAFLLAFGIIACIGMRVRGGAKGFNPVVPWMGQLVTSFLCLVWCVIFIKVSSDTTRVPTPIGNAEMMNSSPSIGVFIAVLGALAALGGSILGLRNKSA